MSSMMKKDKKPAIVQCSLGDMGPATQRSKQKPHSHCHILLRLPNAGAMHPPSDLMLDVGSADRQTLGTILERISERYHVAALIPPLGYSLEALEINRSISELATLHGLPEFGASALAIASNRYLARCHWQHAGLPILPFSLIQFPSALPIAAAKIGFPSMLTPLHHALPNLATHITRENDIPKSYRLVSSVLHRYSSMQPCDLYTDGIDPCTGHHIRFSLATDLLLSTTTMATSWSVTVRIQQGLAEVLTCTPTLRRHAKQKTLNRRELGSIADLAILACNRLHIQTGVATCLIENGAGGLFIDGIRPNFVDHRVIPAITEKCRMSWQDIIWGIYLESSESQVAMPSRPADQCTPTPCR